RDSAALPHSEGTGMRLTFLVIPPALGVLGFSLYALEHRGPQPTRTNDHAPRVIFAGGLVEGRARQLELRPEMTGRLVAVGVTEGDRVSRGSTLARLDPASYEHELAQAEASFELARAERERLLNGARAEARESAQAQARMANARLGQARSRLQRGLQLRRGNAL